MRKVITRIRTAAPQASIRARRPARPLLPHRRTGLDGVSPDADDRDAQRDVAQSMNCAFWDLRDRMGGGGVMPQYTRLASCRPTMFTSLTMAMCCLAACYIRN